MSHLQIEWPRGVTLAMGLTGLNPDVRLAPGGWAGISSLPQGFFLHPDISI